MIQLYAINSQAEVVSISSANKGADYCCLECGQKVHIRSGPWRQAHFYHAASNHTCRQCQKSLIHLHVQLALLKQLPDNDCRLEVRFPLIGRIADVVWFSQKIIFEVQCSPIKISEILQRNRDYESIGYRVVWIMHDHRYNRLRISPAEAALQSCPHYFTNIDGEGRGVIYDQFSLIQGGIRQEKLAPLKIDIRYPLPIAEQKEQPLSPCTANREAWPLCFEGDLFGCTDAYREAAIALEKKYRPRPPLLWNRPLLYYRHLLRLALERNSI